MKKNVGGIITNNTSVGLVTNAPIRPNQETVKLPDLYDKQAIEAQRELLRQQELNRNKQN
jgi:hypothetical protein